ncbi:MAG: hypothetical protein JNK82_30300 [Myxococcaceae bacterium]|nr:hypothetical protein [Myxococcaceae bacterium]
MRGWLPVVLLVVACAPVRVPLDGVYRVGRFEGDGSFSWSASRLSVKFTGSGKVRAAFRQIERPATAEGPGQPVRLQVELDGTSRQLYAEDDGSLVFEQVVPPGAHRLTVVRQSEAMIGAARLEELELPPGAKIEPWQPQPLIEFIGDSMTTGFGVEGQDPCPFSTKTQAVTAAYPWLVGLSLKADVRIVAWSGKGVVRNWGDRPGPTVPDLWKPAEPAPDLVFVALGANDFWSGDAGPNFKAGYAVFLSKVRAAYPNAQLVQLALEPKSAVLDDTIVLDPVPEGYGFGCVGHPSSQTQRFIADQVIERVCRVVKGGAFCGAVAAAP